MVTQILLFGTQAGQEDMYGRDDADAREAVALRKPHPI